MKGETRGRDAAQLETATALAAAATIVSRDEEVRQTAVASGCGVAPSG
jgi:hypothetical protein